MNDRIRAKPPAADADRWREGVVRSVGFDEHEHRYTVTVEPADGSAPAEVTVSEAIYDLFTGRLDAAEPTGETVWFR